MEEGGHAGADAPSRRIYSARISQVLRDLSRQFHDQEHERSNRTRGLRLWAASGLDEGDYVDLLYEARTVTQGKGNIERDATDGSPQGTKNRMPYFFSVVEDLLNETLEAQERGPHFLGSLSRYKQWRGACAGRPRAAPCAAAALPRALVDAARRTGARLAGMPTRALRPQSVPSPYSVSSESNTITLLTAAWCRPPQA